MDEAIVRCWLEKYQPDQVFVAYSGGVDSTALLHLCSQLNTKIIALHVNHQLHRASNDWESHCLKQAQLLGVDFKTIRLTPPAKLSNIEHWARGKRYDFFDQIMSQYSNSLLLSGHHEQDQAETFLLQASRGSGISGLSGIAKEKKIKHGYLIRPFLDITKSQLQSYCIQHQLIWVEDPSNTNTDFKRNAIRAEILPKLQQYFPAINKALATSANWCQEANKLLEFYLQQDLQRLILSDGSAIDIDKLSQINPLQQKHLIKYWLKYYFNINVNPSQLHQIIKGIEKKQSNWNYRVLSLQLSIYYNQLYAKPITSKKNTEITITEVINWLKNYPLNFVPVANNITIRSRQPSDCCRYPGRSHRQKLKVIFQELKIPAPKRNQLKIVCTKEESDNIIGIYPVFVCPEYLK